MGGIYNHQHHYNVEGLHLHTKHGEGTLHPAASMTHKDGCEQQSQRDHIAKPRIGGDTAVIDMLHKSCHHDAQQQEKAV